MNPDRSRVVSDLEGRRSAQRDKRVVAVLAERQAARDRSRRWHEQRRARGICSQAPCNNPVTDINPKTQQPYWACRSCRLSGKA